MLKLDIFIICISDSDNIVFKLCLCPIWTLVFKLPGFLFVCLFVQFLFCFSLCMSVGVHTVCGCRSEKIDDSHYSVWFESVSVSGYLAKLPCLFARTGFAVLNTGLTCVSLLTCKIHICSCIFTNSFFQIGLSWVIKEHSQWQNS